LNGSGRASVRGARLHNSMYLFLGETAKLKREGLM
jgi:hypothetical protein